MSRFSHTLREQRRLLRLPGGRGAGLRGGGALGLRLSFYVTLLAYAPRAAPPVAAAGGAGRRLLGARRRRPHPGRRAPGPPRCRTAAAAPPIRGGRVAPGRPLPP